MDLVPPSKVSNGSGLFQNENGLALFKDEIPGKYHYHHESNPSQTLLWAVKPWAQLHKACKHTNLLNMKFLA